MEENKLHVIQVKLDKELRDKLLIDAHNNFRSVGMHVKAIVTKHLIEQSMLRPKYNNDPDMDNLGG